MKWLALPPQSDTKPGHSSSFSSPSNCQPEFCGESKGKSRQHLEYQVRRDKEGFWGRTKMWTCQSRRSEENNDKDDKRKNNNHKKHPAILATVSIRNNSLVFKNLIFLFCMVFQHAYISSKNMASDIDTPTFL